MFGNKWRGIEEGPLYMERIWKFKSSLDICIISLNKWVQFYIFLTGKKWTNPNSKMEKSSLYYEW